MEVKIVQREPMLVVGWHAKFRSIFAPDANNSNVIGNLWMNTFKYEVASKLPGSLGHPTWGVIWHDGDEADLSYLAGVPFSSLPDLPEGMSSRQVPGGTWAKITHRGPLSGLKDTIEALHVWMRENNQPGPDNWIELELYDERFFKEGPEQEFDYFTLLSSDEPATDETTPPWEVETEKEPAPAKPRRRARAAKPAAKKKPATRKKPASGKPPAKPAKAKATSKPKKKKDKPAKSKKADKKATKKAGKKADKKAAKKAKKKAAKKQKKKGKRKSK
ncbi:MAG: GyrI-like domain-containing protein [Planctomycetes bacterium]|nr:GyrI-like domain-containing protein [Planctomycetota bacterium]